MSGIRTWLIVAGMSVMMTVGTAMAKVDFDKQIKPVLEASCISCHGPAKQKGKLQLHTKELLTKGGDTGKLFEIGKAGESELVRRLKLPKDDDEFMPAKGDPLTKEQIQAVVDWINEGAAWPDGTTLQDTSKGGEEGGKSKLDGVMVKLSPEQEKQLAAIRTSGALVLNLAQTTNLVRVDYHLMSTPATDDSLTPLKGLNNVVELNVAGSKITDKGLQLIGTLDTLVNLHLERTQIGDDALGALKGLKNLEYLNLYGTPVTDKGMAQLAGLKNLKKIYLWETKVTDAGAASLQKALPELKINRGWEMKPEAKPVAGDKPTVTAAKDACFDDGGCCDKALKGGKTCAHPCCVEAAKGAKICEKCNPTQAKALGGKSPFKADGCCDKAAKGGKACAHPCCVEAAKTGKVCTKCNPR